MHFKLDPNRTLLQYLTDMKERSIIEEFVRTVLAEAENPDEYVAAGIDWRAEVAKRYGLQVGRALGEGGYSTVYEAIASDGKPMVVKISDNQDEYKPYRHVMKIKAQLPSSIQRHLPEITVAEPISGIFTTADVTWDKHKNMHVPAAHNQPWSIIACERLRPLPAELKGAFFQHEYGISAGGKRGKEIQDRNTTSNEEMLDAVIKSVIFSKGAGRYIGNIPLKAVTNDELFRVASGAARRGTSSHPQGKWNDYMSERKFKRSHPMNKIIAAIGDELEGFLRQRLAHGQVNSWLAPEFVAQIIGQIESKISKTEFPAFYSKSPSSTHPGATSIPGAGPVLKALYALSKFIPGMEWRDLHYDNLMVRSNGDIVVSDLGFFTGKGGSIPLYET